MNKNLKKISFITLMLLFITATAVSATTITNTINIEPKYTTVTEGFDWGPAITKVTLNMNTTLKEGAVSSKTFNVKSERKYNGVDWTKLDRTSVNPTYIFIDYDKIIDRVVNDAYVSDESGNQTSIGNYVTIEMKIGPDLVEGSPFNYDPKSGLNKYVDTFYIISLNKGEKILNKDSDNVLMATTTEKDKVGNKTLIADDFDLSGVSSYKDDKYGDITLHYASYAPKEDNQKNPLIIWLHGAGEGGTDPTISIIGNKVVNLATDKTQNIFNGAYILAPQSDTMWMNDGTGSYTKDGTSKYTKALMNLIDNYVKAHSDIDTSRIYIGGCSNGGFMTMNMIMNYPRYFTAAYPVCEAYTDVWITDNMLKGIKDMPIWFTQASTDTTVTPDKHTIATYKRLIALGAKNVYFSYFTNVIDTTGMYKDVNGKPYEYNGHWSWIYTLKNEWTKDYYGSNVQLNGKDTSIMEWLAYQSK